MTSKRNRYPLASREMTMQMHSTTSNALALLLGMALSVAVLLVGSTPAAAQFVGPTPLQLINGWTNAPYSTSIATAEEASGIVQFRGAIATTGTNTEPFVLPASLSPATMVYIPIDLCNANYGRLMIEPNGTVFVQAENGTFSNAQCFTSLDGASFAPNATGFTPLTLINGWTNAPYSTSDAAVELINGVVHFKGAIATNGTNAEPFVLPAAYRPTTAVYIPVDLCGATNGRLNIAPNGTVTVEAENGAFNNAQCFTSLDGAWFAKSAPTFKALSLINGWTNAPYSTSDAMAGNAYGMVYLKGAIATSGSNSEPFVLPPAYRPITDVYVPVDLCNATNGRLYIQPNGNVYVEAQESFSNASCFTSLDGVSFVQ